LALAKRRNVELRSTSLWQRQRENGYDDNVQRLAILLAALGLSTASGQTPIVIGEAREIRSEVLAEARSICISKPVRYAETMERYPVLVVLDGEMHFPFVAAMVRFLAAHDRIPELLVVGIPSVDHKRRVRDLTPPSSSAADNRFMIGNGGAAQFLKFLERELMPMIDRNYRTRPNRLLLGHSFGGLFAVHVWMNSPGLFQAFAAIDPTLSWNSGGLIRQAEEFVAKPASVKTDMYIAASGGSTVVAKDIRAFVSLIEAKGRSTVRLKFDWLKDETHGSIPLAGSYQALNALFETWRLTDPLPVYDRGGIAAVHQHFREGGKRWGCERSTPPFEVSLLAAALLRDGRLRDAGEVLVHDPVKYPAPWNQLDALARAYDAQGNRDEAIHWYQLSLVS
jgi:hypothetical protein